MLMPFHRFRYVTNKIVIESVTVSLRTQFLNFFKRANSAFLNYFKCERTLRTYAFKISSI